MKTRPFFTKRLSLSRHSGTLKHFVLSLLATTISIALTFGTAAIIDHRKKQAEKHEIVMMVMFDMSNSLQTIAECDSMLHQALAYQLQIAEDSSRFEELRFNLVHALPNPKFTETTEHIFSSNIETINTVGNALFTENVAEFYLARKEYKEAVCDSLRSEFVQFKPFASLASLLDFDYNVATMMSVQFLLDMQGLFAQCKQMMDVTDEQIAAYRKARLKMEESRSDHAASLDSLYKELMQKQEQINAARERMREH